MRNFTRELRPPYDEQLTLINLMTGHIITWDGQLWYDKILKLLGWPDVQGHEWPPPGEYPWIELKEIDED